MAATGQPNLYSKILGLPEETTSPDHYQLLGIERFEEDPGVIQTAAVNRNRELLKWETSQYHKTVELLMEDVVTARDVLRDPDRKRQYDRELRPGSQRPDPAALEQPAAVEADLADPAQLYQVVLRTLSRDWDYARAVQRLERVPSRGRTPEIHRLLEQCRRKQAESDALAVEIRDALANENSKGLLPQVEAYLRLKPNDPTMGRLAEQLRAGKPVSSATAVSKPQQPAEASRSTTEELAEFCAHYSDDDYHVGKNISQELLETAQQSYGVLRGEQIFALVDATMVGTAEEGLAICETGLYWRNRSQPGAFLSWFEFESTQVKSTGLAEIQFGEAGSFNMISSGCDRDGFLKLLEGLRALMEHGTADPVAATSAATLVDRDAEAAMTDPPAQQLFTFCERYETNDYYVGEHIPQDMLENARRSFAILKGEQVVALIDCTHTTVLESAVDGLAICETGIYWHDQLQSAGFIPWINFASARVTRLAEDEISIGDAGSVSLLGSRCNRDWLLQLLEDLQSFVGRRGLA